LNQKSKPTIGPVAFIHRIINRDEKRPAFYIGSISAPGAGNGAQAVATALAVM
jgi:hypothetical protein